MSRSSLLVHKRRVCSWPEESLLTFGDQWSAYCLSMAGQRFTAFCLLNSIDLCSLLFGRTLDVVVLIRMCLTSCLYLSVKQSLLLRPPWGLRRAFWGAYLGSEELALITSFQLMVRPVTQYCKLAVLAATKLHTFAHRSR